MGPQIDLGDWSPEEFEKNGQELIKLIREHFEQIRSVPVTTQISAQDLVDLLDKPIPEEAVPFEVTLNETWNKVIPHLTHWNHPSFHAYFSNSASFSGILADLLTSALNVNAMVWKSAPAASALEKIVLRWLTEMIGYDQDADGVLVNGASLATFYALVAARDSLSDLDIRTKGLTGHFVPKLRLYTSDQAHSSIDKAAIALGIGMDNVLRLPTDEKDRFIPAKLEEAIYLDLENGYRPLAVVATVGTTATGAVDPISLISEICKKYGIWLHIDSAYGGFWSLVPEVRENTGDLQVGDSIVVNPHKCLYTPLEVTALYCRQKGTLANSFRLVPEYLHTQKEDGSVDFMDYTLQLGRSFRALKIWWVIQSFGREGLVNRLRESIRLSRWLTEEISAHPDFICAASSPYALVCLQYVPQTIGTLSEQAGPAEQKILNEYLNRLNTELLNQLNQSQAAYASHTIIQDRYVIRISIGNIHTKLEDIKRLWNKLQELGPKVIASMPPPTIMEEA